MAKKSIVERERNRQKLVQKYLLTRIQHKKVFHKKNLSLRERLQAHCEIQKLPRNSSPSRVRNRCQFSGRPRGYYRDFGLSRHFFRKIANSGILPGVQKSSW